MSICNKNPLRSATLKEYTKEINELYELHGLLPPIAMDNSSNNVYRPIANLEVEEDVTKHRTPITKQMAVDMIQRGCNVKILSKEALIADIMVLACELGPRAI